MDDKIIEEYKEKLASKDAEITQMKESFDSQVADKVEEVMQLKQEISEIQISVQDARLMHSGYLRT